MKILMKFCLLIFILFMIIPKISNAQVEIIIKPGTDDGKDAYINTYNNYSNGSHQSFIAAAWTYDGTFGIGRSFIQFPLPELPANYTNFTATLNFYYDYSSPHVGHGGDNESKLERITSDWAEYGIDWYNQPSVSTENAVILQTSETSYQNYPDNDVTLLVLDMYEDPSNSFGFRLSLVEEDIYRSLIFASGDHTDIMLRPSLVIRYDTCTLPVNSYTHESDNLHCQFHYSDSSVTSWNWDFGNGFGSVLPNPSFDFDTAGTYIVCVDVENNCGTITTCDSIRVCLNPISDFTYSIDSLLVNFTNLSYNSAEFYWDFGNGFFSTLENPQFQFETQGDYLVCLSATNTCSTVTHCDTVSLSLPSNIDSFKWDARIRLSPNPAHNEVIVLTNGIKIYNIKVYNSQGILVDKINLEIIQNNYRISLQNKAPGLYLLQFKTDNGIITKRLIVL